jgi:NAD(P)-dependent dehydrogenase (short-subunit alcohol dehydrogenase family)
MPERFTGRSVLITGAASGIGRAAAKRFAAEGARLTLGDRDEQRLDVVARELRDAGADPAAILCDVADADDLWRLIDAAGELDVVFGNAGMLRTAPLGELTLADFELHLRVNLTANLLLTQMSVDALRRAGGGAIVFTASLGGLRGSAGSAAYNASKGGLVNLTRSLAVELAPDGIRVNCLCPGWIDTPFNDPFWSHAGPDARASIADAIPMGRQGSPDDVAPAAVFLSSEDAAYITGQTLIIDGGVQAA